MRDDGDIGEEERRDNTINIPLREVEEFERGDTHDNMEVPSSAISIPLLVALPPTLFSELFLLFSFPYNNVHLPH